MPWSNLGWNESQKKRAYCFNSTQYHHIVYIFLLSVVAGNGFDGCCAVLSDFRVVVEVEADVDVLVYCSIH